MAHAEVCISSKPHLHAPVPPHREMKTKNAAKRKLVPLFDSAYQVCGMRAAFKTWPPIACAASANFCPLA